MKYNIKSYLITDGLELTYTDEEIEKLKEAGLTTLAEAAKNNTGDIIPFYKIEYIKAYKLYYPYSINVKKLNFYIPLEIVSLIGLNKVKNYFNDLEVWWRGIRSHNILFNTYALVGYKGWANHYLLAQWHIEKLGEIPTEEEIIKIASKQAKQEIETAIKNRIAEYNQKLQNIDSLIEPYLKDDLYI